jgi:feruloyl esterase
VTAALSGTGALAGSCDTLNGLSLPHGVITARESVAAGPMPLLLEGPGMRRLYLTVPAFCRVSATLKPSPDSDIKIEVWLPESAWNGKFQAVGNGAWAGTIAYPALAAALNSGYASASTDAGHVGNSGAFILGHPEKLTDFAFRAVHEMTVAAKSIVQAYYGTAPKLSYWNGCSTGGRQAFAEAQRYPEDYDGIIAGAPAGYTTHLQGMQVWVEQATHQNEASYIPPEKYVLIHNAVLAACDALDGVKDGVLEDPRRCKFDPGVLACKNGDDASCLTAPQVDLARKIYSGPGYVFPGYEPGSELGWASHAGPKPSDYSVGIFKYAVFGNADWNYLTFDLRDVAKADQVASEMNSIDLDLRPFLKRGGKLLQYHGWSDPGIPPLSSVNYYNQVMEHMTTVSTLAKASFYRLFMVPGMGHCRGGEGTDTFDMVSALERWVEEGKPPEQIPASRIVGGKVVRTRPLCPYPQVAVYKGSGSTDDAANFSCRAQ